MSHKTVAVFLAAISSGCCEFQDGGAILNLTSAVAETFVSTSTIVLRTDNVTWREGRLIFLLTKALSMDHWNYVTVSDFRIYRKLRNRKRNSAYYKMLTVVFGSQFGAARQFEELSHEVDLAISKWLIFLEPETEAEDFVRNADVRVNADVVTAKLVNGTGELKHCFKILQEPGVHSEWFGTWKDGKIKVEDLTVHVSKKKNLLRAKLRVTALPIDPLSLLSWGQNKEIEYGGFLGFVFNELVGILNITRVNVNARSNITGRVENGHWVGIMGMLERNETDLVIAPITYTKKTFEVATVLRPILTTRYQVYFRANSNEIELDAILKPFESKVWLTIGLWLLAASFVTQKIFKMQYDRGLETPANRDEFVHVRAVFSLLRALSMQGNSTTPQSLSCRICFFLFYLACIVLVTSYSAIMVTNLTLEIPSRPFNSLEELLKVGTHRLLLRLRSSNYAYFSEASDDLRREIFEKLIKVIPEKDFPDTAQGCVTKICLDGRYAYFTVQESGHYFIQRVQSNLGCRIIGFKKALDLVSISMAIHKYSPLRTIIDLQLQRMAETGQIKRMGVKAGVRRDMVYFGMQVNPVGMTQVLQVHNVLLLGFLLAPVVLALEVYFSRKEQRPVPVRRLHRYNNLI